MHLLRASKASWPECRLVLSRKSALPKKTSLIVVYVHLGSEFRNWNDYYHDYYYYYYYYYHYLFAANDYSKSMF